MQKSDIFRIPNLKRILKIHLMWLPAALLLNPAGSAFAAGGITVIPDWTVLVQVANFIFLIFILNILLFKPIRKILLERKAKIEGLEENIDSTQKEATSQDEAFAKGLKDARGEGLKQKEALLQEASEEEKAIIDKISDQAQADLAGVRAKIAEDTEAVKTALIKEVDSFADIISEKILGRAV
ncbi:MAG: ATP synthase F0 subunit B [Deltaproteobacteria bacterium]|nr:ATP synthase F0 subunit B [Deltaproteobacteria bacterium]